MRKGRRRGKVKSDEKSRRGEEQQPCAKQNQDRPAWSSLQATAPAVPLLVGIRTSDSTADDPQSAVLQIYKLISASIGEVRASSSSSSAYIENAAGVSFSTLLPMD